MYLPHRGFSCSCWWVSLPLVPVVASLYRQAPVRALPLSGRCSGVPLLRLLEACWWMPGVCWHEPTPAVILAPPGVSVTLLHRSPMLKIGSCKWVNRQIIQMEFSPTWNCVSLTRFITSTKWKLYIFAKMEVNDLLLSYLGVGCVL